MFEWLKKVNNKKLEDDQSLQRNQPKHGKIKIMDDLDANAQIDVKNEELKIEIIKRF